uniref:Hemocyanin beta-subunit n=1 Tax=Helix lucorum TaxID=31229 RepID=G3FPE5_HELLU|nr:hemocyanin beta-subunit [Helix lucorum]
MAKLWFALSLALLICLGGCELVRKNVDKLTKDELYDLQRALRDVVADHSEKGYDEIASFHGYPAKCKHGDHDVACCVHGDPNFPTWHRLLVVQLEQALKDKGLTFGVPYWDWTQELHDLPELVREGVLPDPSGGKNLINPWYEGEVHVGDKTYHTSRAIDERLYQHVAPGQHTDLFEHVLDAFEYTDFCQFEVQFEVSHNYIHSLVGGRSQYSLSSLEYTIYDPIFFLHHSNVERLFQIYTEVQKYRESKGEGGQKVICDIKGYFAPLEPFSRDSNPFPVTKENSSPEKALTNSAAFGYSYDDLTLNGLSPKAIADLIKEKQSHDRAFADFELHNIGASADVRVKVCVDLDGLHHTEPHCEHAGDFFILGGPLEMAWSFGHPFHFEITKTVQKLGLPLDGNYHIEVDIFHINGTELPSDVLPRAGVDFRPAVGKSDPPIGHNEEGHEHEFHEGVSVRKNVDRLTVEEVAEIREALEKFQNDRSVDGYQAIAEFHGDPGKCPSPTARDRLACCVHGMPTFPHWHRLLVVQVEDALRRRGSPIGLPYWDFTRPGAHVPDLANEETYIDPHTGAKHHNPFHDAEIAFLGHDVHTSRDVLPGLSQTPDWGDHTELYDAFLLALEQDDFCDFEVQFEIAHNLIHGLVGGNSAYGLSSLSYSAFDPIFYIYHSSIDRIWAIWTALQQHRHKPYKAHCAQSHVHTPLKPFAFSSPYNNDEKTYSHSTPTNVYDYEQELDYAYDSLEFGGLSITELDDYIDNQIKTKDRVFVSIQLHGIKKSAWATIYVTPPGGEKYTAGHFGLLGGPSEMPWSFDRVYYHDISHALDALNLQWKQPFDVTLELKEFDGTPIDVSQFPKVHLYYKPAKAGHAVKKTESRLRKEVDHLTAEETLELRHALTALEDDKTLGGYQTLGRYHGSTLWCPSPDAQKKVACCLHGMPTFPHWHRLLTVQAENALRKHGYHGGLPYWDWTLPLTSLPEIVKSPEYVDPSNGNTVKNPFYSGHIDDASADTVRSVRPDLFVDPGFGHYTDIAKQVLLAFEQDNFCDFEVQFEIAHNFIHALVGGSEVYSLASLAYTAYDPLFYLHHSNTDRLWAVWQALQQYRGKPFNSANCAVDKIRKPLAPFSLSSDVNPDPVTREHSLPFQVFDYKTNFHCEYDSLEFNGLTIPQLDRLLQHNKAEDRVFVGFRLHGIKHSALTKFYICKKDDCDHLAGEFYLLGDENEMAWTYDRLYKYEITEQLADLHLRYDDRYTIKYEVLGLDGKVLGHVSPEPTVIHEVGTSHIYGQEYRPLVTAGSHVRHNLEHLSAGEVESLRSAFLAIQEDHSYENIAAYHGKPGLCEFEGRKVACCVHGSAAFPPWHRLYVEQVEHALLAQGSSVSIPYWDWAEPIRSLPKLISEATYFNSRKQRFDANPFISGRIAGENATTTRNPQATLFNNDYFYEQVLFAFEQTHFCDFEIQLEVTHNAIHSWLGGHAKYSMASLDYAAFDPVFFLHHTNTDRLWAIWQELQRYRGLPYNEADCAINQMRKPLKPFGDSDNKDNVTRKYSRPVDTFDYRNHFDYEYDNLEFNHQSIPQLENLLKLRHRHGRIFAGFLIHNIGLSADVEVSICLPNAPEAFGGCNHKAAVFSILGGETEMPFEFDRLFRIDITKAVVDAGLEVSAAANFKLKVAIRAVNGSYLDPHILPDPSIIYDPGTDEVEHPHGDRAPLLVRKNVRSLSPLENYHLVKALSSLNADGSADGFQSIATFHAIPPLCPSPTASVRHACCIHGGAAFLQWHRLYTVQFEDALRRHGSHVGLPYWDWVRITDRLPSIFTVESQTDPSTNVSVPNPFATGRVEFEHEDVVRDIQSNLLFKRGPHGWDTWLYNQALYALEQEDYCDFAVQLEITHNSIHAWIGGSQKHSMAHLHYASYDPIFFIHHSNTDRLWAVWQALQEYRGHSANEVNCALEKLREPLKPFSFGPPYNLNPVTLENSHPGDTFDYERHFHYRYDALEFVGMNIPTLDAYIKKRQEHDRVFAGFLLKGIHQSATVDFDICKGDTDNCFVGGYFSILGGPAEMEWEFDRLYNYEITDQLKEHHIRYDDDYHFKIQIIAPDGAILDSHLLHEPTVSFVPARHDLHLKKVPLNKIRRNIDSLEERDIQSLQTALHDLQEDDSNNGWANLASFHGAPARCPDPEHPKVACCQHGMPTFPHWHRLFTLQVEQALQAHGSSLAIPYWDWTSHVSELPKFFTEEDYYDVWKDEVLENPFAHGYIPSEGAYTVRDVYPLLFRPYGDGKHTFLFYIALEALEQTDYCDFEVQFEILHNAIHYLVGGEQKYSLSSLEYSAYDPLFFIHHSFVDKIWVVWQELQRKRHLPYNRADCAVAAMNQPMKPFIFESINPNKFTREHALPSSVFDHEDLGYGYDNLNIGGYTVEELEELIHDREKEDRVFAGFLLKGIGTSGVVTINICIRSGNCTFGGRFSLLGGPLEAPWAYDRLYKREITQYLGDIHIEPKDVLNASVYLKVEVDDVEGRTLSPKAVFPYPTIIFKAGHKEAKETKAVPVPGDSVRKNVNDLTDSEVANLRAALRDVQADDGANGFASIAGFHGSPAHCEHDHHPVACCLHGMAGFPRWHRLYVKQWEDALIAHGSKNGIPYWDWTQSFTELPTLVTQVEDNPFHHGKIDKDHNTTRSPRPQLFSDPASGDESFFYRQVLLAFEQTDYCDFEVQFEFAHNAIHSWTGGKSPYGMSTLEYTAYDPLFLVHHSNVDRQFAIWQALQKFRGLPYNSANCAIQLLHQPMRPFSDSDNVNPTTRAHSTASEAFNYEQLHYHYDNLNFHGDTISQLVNVIDERKSHDRIFAEFLLHSIGTSADVTFELCDEHNHCEFAGTFAILGGPLEMAWSTDRLFRYDVTDVFEKLHLQADSEYHFVDHIVAVNGTELDSHLIKPPSVRFVPGTKVPQAEQAATTYQSSNLVRKSVNSLTLGEASNLKQALRELQADHGPGGFEAIAGFHGYPFLCPEKSDTKYACCVHGMPTFPHWHRLFTVQFEQALKQHGSIVGIPYWDWTAPGRALPPFLTDVSHDNPFSSYTITSAGKTTTRSPLEALFSANTSRGHTILYDLTLDALEEEDYCHFEASLEFLHNRIHFFIGGTGTYSMSTLDYSAFDPLFMVVHSGMDRIWDLWEQLQKLRHKSYKPVDCGGHTFDKPLHPFDFPAINTIALTRQNAIPELLFEHDRLGYEYDNLRISGYDVEQVNEILKKRHAETRIYYSEAAAGQGVSVSYEVWVLDDEGHEFPADTGYTLGSSKEMPWTYEILSKYDITDAIHKANVSLDHPVKFKWRTVNYDGTLIEEASEYGIVVVREANTDYLTLIIPIGAEKYPLSPKLIVPKDTHVKFLAVNESYNYPIENLVSLTSLNRCTIPRFPFDQYNLGQVYALTPGDYYFTSSNEALCKSNKRIYIVVEDH